MPPTCTPLVTSASVPGSSSYPSPISRSATATSFFPPWPSATVGRPNSAGTTSTSSSSRPWVFDSDASSICSVNSNGCSSGSQGEGNQTGPLFKKNGSNRERRVTGSGDEEEIDEGGEVFKAQGDVEFLDHRPEPPGAKLSINRDDPAQVLLKVTLPGFSLDNITVAMRRGHKVHIVADSYGESGGHFEKLIHLGSDVSSTAPRAEFNGTDLNIYIQRRPSRPSSSASSAGGSSTSVAPFGAIKIPGSPSSTFSSPDLEHRRPSIASSLASTWSASSDFSGGGFPVSHPLSPSLEYPLNGSSSNDSTSPMTEEDFSPPFTVVAPPMNPLDAEHRKSKSRSLTGPEGAKAAAKAAREEASRRAKEEAMKLPSSARGGRRLPFRRPREDGTDASSGSGSMGEGSGNNSAGEGSASSLNGDGLLQAITEAANTQSTRDGIDRNGTIKANSRSNSPLPPPASSSESSLASSATSSASSSAVSSPASSPSRAEPRPLPLFANPHNSYQHHSRPKMRDGNLTLRAPDGSSFIDEAQSKWAWRESGNESEIEGENLTPRREKHVIEFTPMSSA